MVQVNELERSLRPGKRNKTITHSLEQILSQ